jgi:hypothetical protein
MEGQNGAQNLDTKGNGVQKEWSKDGKAEISYQCDQKADWSDDTVRCIQCGNLERYSPRHMNHQ